MKHKSQNEPQKSSNPASSFYKRRKQGQERLGALLKGHTAS